METLLPARAWSLRSWLAKPRVRRRERRLRLVETLPLGERRFVAVVSIDGHEFLVGATPQSLSLLGELGCDSNPFAEPPNLSTREVQ
ncbi:MAG TPA: flagellar biosynthetic protein FliO [Terriglobales bacterium]|nr:flagellar biosynthetic protein FliO [Terriglobales bacterium]